MEQYDGNLKICTNFNFRARVSRIQFKLVILVIWIISGLMAAPILYTMRTVQMDHYGEKFFFCYPVKFTPQIMLTYRSVLVLLQYVLPLAVISWVYARMGLAPVSYTHLDVYKRQT